MATRPRFSLFQDGDGMPGEDAHTAAPDHYTYLGVLSLLHSLRARLCEGGKHEASAWCVLIV